MFDSRGRCSSPFPSHRASVCPKTIFPWSHGQCDLDTERCYLPTEVVHIYLLTFACFRTTRLVGAGTSNGSSLRCVDSILRLLGLLTLQHRLLQFSPQRHHVPAILKWNSGKAELDSLYRYSISDFYARKGNMRKNQLEIEKKNRDWIQTITI